MIPTNQDYSPECFTAAELRGLGQRALRILGCSEYGREMRNQLIAVVLAQGAALHYAVQTGSATGYLDPAKAGIKDVDIWFFFADDGRKFNPRWSKNADLGPGRFGRYPADPPHYVGRRIDLFGRSISVVGAESPSDSIRRWLEHSPRRSPSELRTKAVVGLFPEPLVGEVIWVNPALAAPGYSPLLRGLPCPNPQDGSGPCKPATRPSIEERGLRWVATTVFPASDLSR